MTPEERAAWEARTEESIRGLRELVDRGWDELEAKGLAEKWGGRPKNAEERLERLRQHVARGKAELEARRRAAESGG